MESWIIYLMMGIQLLLLLVLVLRQKPASHKEELEKLLRKSEVLEQQSQRMERQMKEELEKNREAFSRNEKEARRELTDSLRQFESVTERRMERIREVMEQKMTQLQQDNNTRLEEMRATVDEKLHKTLEHRLGESFKQVSERLEQVHQGLGEMQTLAAGVGDLKKVLTNVKTRGTLGEYQLENLLEQLMTSDQYGKNVATRPGSNERVEFAVKMPGRSQEDIPVWLPVDAKFPTEDYQQLLEAYEVGDATVIDQCRKKLVQRMKTEAKNIRDKYVEPPHTTDFGILFLPFEGLYAEVLRLDLFEVLQREYKVMIAGPTTLAAFLNSLQMGFRTLAIEKRSSEVWELLGAVKSEFGKFAGILEKTRQKLDEAGKVIDTAGVRTRAIERRLREVEALPAEAGEKLLGSGFSQSTEETNRDFE
ncbi:DNA recombination protein RmuC [Anoxynatronum buryatiense]|uniref:DNA recombination protein RmuC n=1 Tax=Anoxynatronum buryatiense TaxID=489973 RepID=A0AA46AJI7_9CLOT|nr:DNA recombination protein RmuC [Anoxynatronum buryatiense]SMP60430.1 DNA recombination protein RmuC [Anoxynatronum buryatiense]